MAQSAVPTRLHSNVDEIVLNPREVEGQQGSQEEYHHRHAQEQLQHDVLPKSSAAASAACLRPYSPLPFGPGVHSSIGSSPGETCEIQCRLADLHCSSDLPCPVRPGTNMERGEAPQRVSQPGPTSGMSLGQSPPPWANPTGGEGSLTSAASSPLPLASPPSCPAPSQPLAALAQRSQSSIPAIAVPDNLTERLSAATRRAHHLRNMRLPPPTPAPRGGLTALALPSRPVHPNSPPPATTAHPSRSYESATPPPGPLSGVTRIPGNAPFPSPALCSLFSQVAPTPRKDDGGQPRTGLPGPVETSHPRDKGAIRVPSLPTPGTPGIEDRASRTPPIAPPEARVSSGDLSFASSREALEGRGAEKAEGCDGELGRPKGACDPVGSGLGPAHVVGRALGFRPIWEEYVRLAGTPRIKGTPGEPKHEARIAASTDNALASTGVDPEHGDDVHLEGRAEALEEGYDNLMRVVEGSAGSGGPSDLHPPGAGAGGHIGEKEMLESLGRVALRAEHHDRRDTRKPLASCSLQTLSESGPCLIPSILKSDRLHPLPDVQRGELPSILKADSVDWTVAEAVREWEALGHISSAASRATTRSNSSSNGTPATSGSPAGSGDLGGGADGAEPGEHAGDGLTSGDEETPGTGHEYREGFTFPQGFDDSGDPLTVQGDCALRWQFDYAGGNRCTVAGARADEVSVDDVADTGYRARAFMGAFRTAEEVGPGPAPAQTFSGGPYAPSARGETPGEGWASPAGAPSSHLSPHDCHLSPHDRHLSPHDCHLSPHDRHLSPHNRHLSPDDRHLAPDDRHLAPYDRHLAPDNRHPLPDDRHMLPHDSHLSPDDRHTLPDDRHLSPHDSHLSPHGLHKAEWGTSSAGCDAAQQDANVVFGQRNWGDGDVGEKRAATGLREPEGCSTDLASQMSAEGRQFAVCQLGAQRGSAGSFLEDVRTVILDAITGGEATRTSSGAVPLHTEGAGRRMVQRSGRAADAASRTRSEPNNGAFSYARSLVGRFWVPGAPHGSFGSWLGPVVDDDVNLTGLTHCQMDTCRQDEPGTSQEATNASESSTLARAREREDAGRHPGTRLLMGREAAWADGSAGGALVMGGKRAQGGGGIFRGLREDEVLSEGGFHVPTRPTEVVWALVELGLTAALLVSRGIAFVTPQVVAPIVACGGLMTRVLHGIIKAAALTSAAGQYVVDHTVVGSLPTVAVQSPLAAARWAGSKFRFRRARRGD